MCQLLQSKACQSFRPQTLQALAWSLASVTHPGVSCLAPLGSLDEHLVVYEDVGSDWCELLPTARVFVPICTLLGKAWATQSSWRMSPSPSWKLALFHRAVIHNRLLPQIIAHQKLPHGAGYVALDFHPQWGFLAAAQSELLLHPCSYLPHGAQESLPLAQPALTQLGHRLCDSSPAEFLALQLLRRRTEQFCGALQCQNANDAWQRCGAFLKTASRVS